MAAYGHVAMPTRQSALDVRLYSIPPFRSSHGEHAEFVAILTLPFECANATDRQAAPLPPALQTKLRNEFNDELAKGITYPQRGPLDENEFASYFLTYDLIAGVFVTQAEADQLSGTEPFAQQDHKNGVQVSAVAKADIVRQGRDWSATYAFSYYIKPNYPGRSSHLCNAGFIVSPVHRGLGLGSIAGNSFLHYGPRAGYRGSVFNLVYVNNVASVRIWERLGFERVGRIPGAGLLKKQLTASDDGAHQDEEEYVDAWVIYGDFAKLGR